MLMISKKDLNSAEMNSLTKSSSPTDSHNSQWRSADAWRGHSLHQRIGYFLETSKIRQQSYRSESFARTRVFLRMDQWSKTTSHQKRDSDTVQHGELRSDRASWFVNEFFLQFSLFNIHDTFKAGDWSSYVFLKIIYLTNHDSFKRQWDKSKGRHVWDRFRSSICVKWTCGKARTVRHVSFRYTRNGCKNSEKISRVMEFLNTETHTSVLPMKYLWSPHPRDVRIWVNTVFILISLKTEIATSVRGPKL